MKIVEPKYEKNRGHIEWWRASGFRGQSRK